MSGGCFVPRNSSDAPGKLLSALEEESPSKSIDMCYGKCLTGPDWGIFAGAIIATLAGEIVYDLLLYILLL